MKRPKKRAKRDTTGDYHRLAAFIMSEGKRQREQLRKASDGLGTPDATFATIDEGITLRFGLWDTGRTVVVIREPKFGFYDVRTAQHYSKKFINLLHRVANHRPLPGRGLDRRSR